MNEQLGLRCRGNNRAGKRFRWKGQRDVFFANEASKTGKTSAETLGFITRCAESRDVSTVAENFRVFWKGCEAKASVGEKRAGARRTWPSRRDLSVRPSKRILSSASDELLRVEMGRGG